MISRRRSNFISLSSSSWLSSSVATAASGMRFQASSSQSSSQQPLTPTPSRHGPNAGRDARSSTNTSAASGRGKKRFENAPTTMPPWQRLAKLCRREHSEEQRRAYRPPFPKVPTGWKVLHDAGTAYFTMTKTVSPVDRAPGSSAEEELTIFCAGSIKEPERTFRHDDGEREDPEHLNYTLFVAKPGAVASGKAPGGLEIQMTTIDHELVLDAVTVHATKEEFDMAWKALVDGPEHQYKRDLQYRGPYVGELDEEFVDEILNYLDERGINNAFASYMQSQWHWFEQLEYEEWLTMYQTFSTPGITSVAKDSATSESTSGAATEAPTKESDAESEKK